ncbi:MAG: 3-keto-5-aminohexanoate cleavage protein, partial [Pseudomonadota bacterium]
FPDPNNEAVALPESDIAGAEERVAHLVACRPEIASLDVTTGNQVFDGRDGVYLNTTHTLRKMAKLFQELDVKPEIEVFGAGDILFAKQLVAEGLVDGVPMIQMVLGVNWASPSDAETVQYLRGYFDPGTCWGVLGIGREQMRMVAQSMLLGGNARVGLEDNLYLDKGVFATNGQLVERAITIIRALGEDVATPAETRQMLGLKNGP